MYIYYIYYVYFIANAAVLCSTCSPSLLSITYPPAFSQIPVLGEQVLDYNFMAYAAALFAKQLPDFKRQVAAEAAAVGGSKK